MSSFIMTKSEAVVLFDLLAASSIPVGIKDLPQVDEFEYERIVASFLANRLIDNTSETIMPDKGLERFLLPIMTAKEIMLFNYGVGGTCVFNTSLYFSKSSLVAMLDYVDGTIKFLTIDSVEDLLLFIPDIEIEVTSEEGEEPYISYILINNMSSIVHCTRICIEKNIARIVEGKRTIDPVPLEATAEVELHEYKEMLHDKFKELYHVVGC